MTQARNVNQTYEQSLDDDELLSLRLVHSSSTSIANDRLDARTMMEPTDCLAKDCSAMYRFQFATIAFLCAVCLPLTFHSNIWSLYTQPIVRVNCTDVVLLHHTESLAYRNRSECCLCQGIFGGTQQDRHWFTACQTWIDDGQERKANIIDEVRVR